MRKLLLLTAAFSIVFFTSCEDSASGENTTPSENPAPGENEIMSLEGTSWKDTNIVSNWELVFLSGRCTITRHTTGAPELLEGTYSYDSPTVTVNYPGLSRDETTFITLTALGTVKGNTMAIEILTGDLVWGLELEKQ